MTDPNDVVMLMLPPLLCGGAGLATWYFPVRVLAVVRGGIRATLLIWAVLAGTGVLAIRLGPVHRFLAEGFVLAMWLMAPVAIGVSLAAAVRGRRWRRMVHVVLMVLALGAVLLSAVTGNLYDGGGSGATWVRFVLLHAIFFPSVAALLMAAWLSASGNYLRPRE